MLRESVGYTVGFGSYRLSPNPLTSSVLPMVDLTYIDYIYILFLRLVHHI